jgi:hypothetical protein
MQSVNNPFHFSRLSDCASTSRRIRRAVNVFLNFVTRLSLDEIIPSCKNLCKVRASFKHASKTSAIVFVWRDGFKIICLEIPMSWSTCCALISMNSRDLRNLERNSQMNNVILRHCSASCEAAANAPIADRGSAISPSYSLEGHIRLKMRTCRRAFKTGRRMFNLSRVMRKQIWS